MNREDRDQANRTKRPAPHRRLQEEAPGCPVARPVASSSNQSSSLVNLHLPSVSAHDIVADDSSATHRANQPGRAVSQRLRTLADSLAPLDWQVMVTVARFRLLTGQQLNRRFFPASPAGARANRRLLLRLTRADVLMRLERRIGGVRGGSAGFIYALGLEGQKLLNQGRRARRHHEAGWPFTKHTLAISELYVQLCEETAADAATDLLVFDPEPLSWRRQRQADGTVLELRPDAYVVLDRQRRRQFWFIEVDRGTESKATIRRKMHQYLDWLHTGYEQDRLNGVFPRVLWHSTDLSRSAVLADIAQRLDGPTGLHVVDGLLTAERPPEEPP